MPHSHYETSNVHLGSFLLCQGAVLDGYRRVSHRKVVFRFIADEKLHELLRLYWGNVPVPLVALALFTSLQRLKKLVRRKPGTPSLSAPSAASPCPDPAAPAC